MGSCSYGSRDLNCIRALLPGWRRLLLRGQCHLAGSWGTVADFTVLSSFRELQQKEVPAPTEQRKRPPPLTSELSTGYRQGTPSPGPSSLQLVPSRQPGSWPGPAYDFAGLIILNILLPQLNYSTPPLHVSFVCTCFSPSRPSERSVPWPCWRCQSLACQHSLHRALMSPSRSSRSGHHIRALLFLWVLESGGHF